MRRVLLGLLGVAFVTDAFAADWLRGSTYEAPSASYNWQGVYFGAQAAYSNADMDMGDAGQQQLANLTRHSFLDVSDAQAAAGQGFQVSRWLSLPRVGASGVSYGGFVGYNSQWGDAVFGVEANYNITSLEGTSADSLSRWMVLDEYRYLVSTSGSVTAKITDFGSVRFRAGYAAGAFLPYVAVGVAAGRADYVKTASVSYPVPTDLDPAAGRPLPPGYSASEVEAKSGVFSVGYSLGAGVDVGLLPNVFVRGEYEFVQLTNFGGVSPAVHNFRSAVAAKF